MPRTIKAPMPGIFYRRPDPNAEPYVEEGAAVQEGETFGLIEVMKTFQEVKADAPGTVTRFLVEDEGEVSIGQDIVEFAE